MASRKTAPVGSWVLVTWHDAADEKGTWMVETEIDEELIAVRSVGYLVRHTKRYLTLAGCVNIQAAAPNTPVFGRVTRIPTGMIASMSVLMKKEKA